MARSKSKPTPSQALEVPASNVGKLTAPKVEKRELILTDFRVAKVVAERFAAPEKARSGTYRVESNADKVVFPYIEVSRIGLISYNLSVTGRTTADTDGPDKKPTKSFSIEIQAEGQFEVVGDIDLDDEKMCTLLLEPVLVLMHGLCIHQARAEADSMGYRTIRPTYQARNMKKPTLSAAK